MRTTKEVNEQIENLRNILKKKSFKRTTMFGDSNVDALEGQIETLERKFTEDICCNREGNEWTEHVASAAREAASWLFETIDETPTSGWEGLY